MCVKSSVPKTTQSLNIDTSKSYWKVIWFPLRCNYDMYVRSVFMWTTKQTHGQNQFYGTFNKELFGLAQNPKLTQYRFHNYFIPYSRRGRDFTIVRWKFLLNWVHLRIYISFNNNNNKSVTSFKSRHKSSGYPSLCRFCVLFHSLLIFDKNRDSVIYFLIEISCALILIRVSICI